MSIIKRLGLIIAVLTAAVLAVGAFNFAELRSVQATALETKESRVYQLREAAAVELNVTRVSLQLRHAMLARTPAEADSAFKDIVEKRELMSKILKDYEGRIISSRGREVFSKIPPLVDAFWRVGEKNIALIQQGDKEAAFAFLVEQTIPARNNLLAALEQTVAYQTEALSQDIEDISATINVTLFLQLGAFAAIMGLLGGFAIWLRQALQKRILQSSQVAKAVASGDLTVPIHDDGKDEFTPLLQSLRQMQFSLTEVVGNVRAAASSVSNSSADIAQGNSHLSDRTEQQASSVQETVSTIENLHAVASRNAENTENAKGLASQASRIAMGGGEAMQKVVDTMSDIAAGSQRIAEIVQVIDGIAFQTNILALNAAVEAARAGDEGRGFAVVAAEVRRLAQRSAQASKEIGTLIHSSSEKVALGSELVEQAGKTIAEVVQSIQNVDQIMTEIRDAGTTQARSLHSISSAVEKIDQSIQQNAALVEQSSANADDLKQRANELVNVVAVFRLGEGQGQRFLGRDTNPSLQFAGR